MEVSVAAEQRGQHIILCGLDELGLRILEQLRRLGEDVVVIARAPGEEFATEARALGAQLLDGAYRDESVLRAARVPDASALVLAEDDDVENLHAALTAQELNPRLRIVLRMFNRELGLRVQTLFRDCSVFSSSAIAAPAFVAAALHEDWEQRFEVAGRVLVVRQGDARDPSVLLPLARVDAFGETALFPAGGEGLLCLADAGPSQGVPGGEGDRPRSRSYRPRLRGWRVSTWTVLLADRRLRVLAALLLALMVVSVAVFSRYAGLDPVSAVYFTVTVITTTGFGDINLRDASPALKMYGTALMLLGTAALTILYALITDAIVSARLARVDGPARDLHDHIVVCGLGNVGYRVVEAIARQGKPVAAAEINEEAIYLHSVRSLGVPVVIADARLPETMEALRVRTARCLVVATDDDVANLETVLNARSLNPELRVVLRLFDTDLARRVERAFGIHLSRSVAALAAPAFAAAAVGERVLATTPVGVHALVFAETVVEPGSEAAGHPLGALESRAEGRVILVTRKGARTWRAGKDAVLLPGDELVIVATRVGLARFFDLTAAPERPVHQAAAPRP